MADNAVDSVVPWSIRGIGSGTKDRITAAAKREGLSVGGLIEKMAQHWFDDGEPAQVAPPAPSLAMPPETAEGLAALATAALSAMKAAGQPVPRSFAVAIMADARRTMKQRRETGATPSHDAVAQTRRRQIAARATLSDNAVAQHHEQGTSDSP